MAAAPSCGNAPAPPAVSLWRSAEALRQSLFEFPAIRLPRRDPSETERQTAREKKRGLAAALG
jgi:hypothetical protein